MRFRLIGEGNFTGAACLEGIFPERAEVDSKEDQAWSREKMQRMNISLQAKITLLVCGVVAVALMAANYLVARNLQQEITDNIGRSTSHIAEVTALSPQVIAGLSGNGSTAEMQAFAAQVARTTNSQFVVVFDMQGVRRAHPNPAMIGKHIAGGDETAALQGQEYTSIAQGSLGKSLRAFCPVYDAGGRQVGGVVVGVLLDQVEEAVAVSHRGTYYASLIGLLIGISGALLLAHNIKTTLLGLEPAAIARMLKERQAMLQSVREGIIAIDTQSRITLTNQAAERLLALAGVNGPLGGQLVTECVPNTRLNEVLHTGQAQYDQEQDLNGISLLTNRLPIVVNGTIVGAIATFRDMSDMRRLAEELTGVQAYVEALRSQAHEFMNKLQVVMGMVHTGSYQELAAYIQRVAEGQQGEMQFVGRRIREAVLAGFILSKMSRARELGVSLQLAEVSSLPPCAAAEETHQLVTILGNLLDNAFDAVAAMPQKEVSLLLVASGGRLQIEVSDSGCGMSDATARRIFEQGFSTKGRQRGLGLGLAVASVAALQGTIEFISHAGEGTTFFIDVVYHSKGE